MNATQTDPTSPAGIPVDFSSASIHMPASDARALRVYFRSGGLSGCNGSNWGQQLERLFTTAGGSKPCEDCGGSEKDGRAGSGFMPVRKPKKKREQNEALSLLMGEEIAAKVEAEIPQMSGDYCVSCGGRGIVALRKQTRPTGPVTVRPTGSSKHGRVPNTTIDVDLLTVGRILRCIAALREVWPEAVAVIGAKFGPDSDSEEGGNSLFPIYPLTEAGKKLLRKNPTGLPAVALLANEYSAAIEHNDATKKLQFAAAKVQAQELYRRACQAWNAAVHPEARSDLTERADRLLRGEALQ